MIAVIAVLAAILFPVMARAKDAANGSSCLSNMHQVGSATSLYIYDWDNTWFGAVQVDPLPGFADQRPWIGYDNNNGPTDGNGYSGRVNQPAVNPARPGAIDPYLKDRSAILCPNKPRESQTALALNGWKRNSESDPEFGPAMETAQKVNGLMSATGVNNASIERPAETLTVWEHDAGAPMCNFLQPPSWTVGPPNDPDLLRHFNLLHGDGTNTVWADNHVRRMVYRALRREYFTVLKSK